MTRTRVLVELGALSVVAVAVAAIGCSKTSTHSTSPGELLVITAQNALHHPGDVVQLGFQVSGLPEAVLSSDVSWSVDDQTVATVRPDGLLTAVGYGRTVVYLTYHGAKASAKTQVLPDSMFLISGTAAYIAYTVPEARVSVIHADGSETTTTANQNGFFRLPGSGQVIIRADKDGYTRGERTVTVSGDMTVSVPMTWLGVFESIAGPWAFTFTPSATCTMLPPEARRRQLSADIIEPEGRNTLLVWLSGPTIYDWADVGFAGTRNENALQFTIFDTFGRPGQEAEFIEWLDADRTLGVSGTAVGTVEGQTMVAQLNGRVRIRGGTPRTVLAECQATDHKLEFTRSASAARR